MGEGSQKIQIPVTNRCHGNIMHSMATIVNNTVLHIQKLGE